MTRRRMPTVQQTLRHTARTTVAPALFIVLIWALGAVGLYLLEFQAFDHGWVDAVYWAAMILTGMGPPELAESAVSTKLFLSGYALLSGYLFLGAVGFALQPVFARVLHYFHLDDA